jgi:hypothetical protein
VAAAVSYSESIHSDETWFLAKARGKKAHEYLIGLAQQMRQRQSQLAENTRKCIAIYQWGGDSRELDDTSDPALEESTVAFNAAQNVIETVHAKICKSRILPMPLTSGGGYLARHRAKECGKALEGEFDENDVDSIKEDVVLDALVTGHGAGAAKVFEHEGRVCIQHVPIEDIWFDEAEIRYRKPRCCYHVQRVDQFLLLEQFAGKDESGLDGSREERADAIRRAASRAISHGIVSVKGDATQIEVIEAWHLPSCHVDPDAETYEHDGRHVIAIDGCTLVDEPWDGECFPFAFYVPRKRRRSIWGLSMMFALVAPQREYEKLTAKIQNQHQKMGVSGWVAPKNADINWREITAGTFAGGWQAEYAGQVPPTPVIVDPVAQGTYLYKDSIPRDMMQNQGVSQLSAQSQVPAGLSQASGKALQVFEDFEAERLLVYHRELERWTVRLAWLVIETARKIAENDNGYSVRYRGKRGFEKLTWKKVLVDREDLILKVFPVSQLSKQPSARFAQLTELLNAQAITVEQFKRLYELPDIEAENELDTADTDIIDRNLDIMVTTGRYMSPEPWDVGPERFQTLIGRAGKFYNLCRQHEVPEDRLRLISDYIVDAKSLKEQMDAEEAAKAAASAPPPPPPGMGAPPGMPPMDPGMPPPMPGMPTAA